MRTPCSNDVWVTYTARGRTRSNAIARLRPTPEAKRPYPHSSHLAHAVIAQAIRDATPEKDRGGKPFMDNTKRRRLQCESLLWLCGNDPDLLYWAMLADYPIRHLHSQFRPLLLHFMEQHREIAESFHLPTWTRPCA
jgi:hypothetical protein